MRDDSEYFLSSCSFTQNTNKLFLATRMSRSAPARICPVILHQSHLQVITITIQKMGDGVRFRSSSIRDPGEKADVFHSCKLASPKKCGSGSELPPTFTPRFTSTVCMPLDRPHQMTFSHTPIPPQNGPR